MYNIGRVVLSLLQTFRTIYSAEKGKKGQVVIARYVWKRERGRGRPWRKLRFVTLTFPFAAVASPARPSARGPHPRAYSFLTSPARFTPPPDGALWSNTHDSSENPKARCPRLPVSFLRSPYFQTIDSRRSLRTAFRISLSFSRSLSSRSFSRNRVR